MSFLAAFGGFILILNAFEDESDVTTSGEWAQLVTGLVLCLLATILHSRED